MKTVNSLPEGYKLLKKQKNYLKPAQLKEGDNRLRVVQYPIGGWEDWKDNKPIRFKPDQKPKFAVNPEKAIKAFWALYVWDYAQEDLFIINITQNSILSALIALAEDSDWGDITTYDIKIKKEGSGLNSKYTVAPLKPTALSAEIERMLLNKPARLEALYDGKDPWEEAAFAPFVPEEKMEAKESSSDFDLLKETLQKNGMQGEQVAIFVTELSQKKGVPTDDIVQSALLNADLTRRFITSYKAWLLEEGLKAAV